METLRATVVEVDKKHLIIIEAEEEIHIPISEDKPNSIKSAFNQLIARIWEGEFQIELNEVGEDLFSQVSKEYIGQLNKELLEVRAEMNELGLLED